MDGQEKKFVAQLDSDVENILLIALRAVKAYHKSTGRTFRGMIAETDQQIEQVTELRDFVQQQEAHISALSADNDQLRAINERCRLRYLFWLAAAARLRGLWDWIVFHPQQTAAGAALLIIGAVLFNFYGPGTGPAAVAERQKIDKAFYAMAASWSWGEGETEPRVYTVERQSYWVIARGNTESGAHADAFGQAVELHCLHLYAKPAVADYGAYLKPGSRNAFGPFSWPERGTSCKPATTRKAER